MFVISSKKAVEPELARYEVKTPDEVSVVVFDLVGEKLCKNGIPFYIETEGWADLATWGETFDCDDFRIECMEGDW